MKPKTRFALVGAGGIAQSYAQAFDGCRDAELIAVADIRAEAARALAERVACPGYSSHRELVTQADRLEAVVICTPPNTHEELAVFFAERGVHVLCEKPFTLDVTSARRVLKAGERAGVKVTMASKFRYADDVIRAKS